MLMYGTLSKKQKERQRGKKDATREVKEQLPES